MQLNASISLKSIFLKYTDSQTDCIFKPSWVWYTQLFTPANLCNILVIAECISYRTLWYFVHSIWHDFVCMEHFYATSKSPTFSGIRSIYQLTLTVLFLFTVLCSCRSHRFCRCSIKQHSRVERTATKSQSIWGSCRYCYFGIVIAQICCVYIWCSSFWNTQLMLGVLQSR